MTELADANILSARSVVTELGRGKDEEELADLPKVPAMKRKILRIRENKNDPKNPEKKLVSKYLKNSKNIVKSIF